MGTRTPGLLHAMQLRSDHSSPLPFTADTADLPVRSPEAAAVHGGSRRTVTNLVTSRPRMSGAGRRSSAGGWLLAELTGARAKAMPAPFVPRPASVMTHACKPASIGEPGPALWLRAASSRGVPRPAVPCSWPVTEIGAAGMSETPRPGNHPAAGTTRRPWHAAHPSHTLADARPGRTARSGRDQMHLGSRPAAVPSW
jgi:hypothetical protein